MLLTNPLQLLLSPSRYWHAFAQAAESRFKSFIPYLLIMALIPGLSWYYGTTNIGWQIGDGDLIRLTPDSAIRIAAAFYVALVLSIMAIGYAVHWMAATYGSQSTILKGIAFAALTATPFFVLGLTGLYPLFWLDLLLGFVGISWSTWLLYKGIPVAMGIPEDQGFLYTSALVSVVLVIFLVLLGATAVLWDMGFLPVFAD